MEDRPVPFIKVLMDRHYRPGILSRADSRALASQLLNLARARRAESQTTHRLTTALAGSVSLVGFLWMLSKLS